MTFDEQLARSLETLTGHLRDEVTRQVRLVSDELAATARAEREELAATARAVREEAAAASRAERVPAERAAPTGRLADGIRAISRARSLSEVLDTLVDCAAQEAARAGVLLVRGSRFHGRRFAGFGPSFGDAEPIDIARADAGVITEAASAAAIVSLAENDRAVAPAFAQLPPDCDCMAAPLLLGDQTVAVLYADNGHPNLEAGTGNLEPGTLNLEALEILSCHAARCLEALTAIKAARALTTRPDSSRASEIGTSDDSADEYAAARRYARLLVSEIKLYHEGQVVAGRRERDLTTRLGGEIARARALYEQRVSPDVLRSTDYVHEELIRTLADGDASLLEVGT